MHFSTKCKVFSLPGGGCAGCKKVLRAHTSRKCRMEKGTDINPRCNKRYLRKEYNRVNNRRLARSSLSSYGEIVPIFVEAENFGLLRSKHNRSNNNLGEEKNSFLTLK